jgi:hypothetical protein
MEINARTKELRELMAAHDLNEKQVASMLDRTAMTVKIWRCQTEDSKCIPAHMLELLRLKVAK